MVEKYECVVGEKKHVISEEINRAKQETYLLSCVSEGRLCACEGWSERGVSRRRELENRSLLWSSFIFIENISIVIGSRHLLVFDCCNTSLFGYYLRNELSVSFI